MSDATATLQSYIMDAYRESIISRSPDSRPDLEIELKKGDYPLQTIEVPARSRLVLYSKDRVRLLYVGKRNRPLFALQDEPGPCEQFGMEELRLHPSSSQFFLFSPMK